MLWLLAYLALAALVATVAGRAMRTMGTDRHKESPAPTAGDRGRGANTARRGLPSCETRPARTFRAGPFRG